MSRIIPCLFTATTFTATAFTATAFTATAFTATAFLALTAPAQAHAQLKKAVPAVGGTVVASPGDIRLFFSEGIVPRFSPVALSGKAGAKVPLGKPRVDPADHAVLIVPVATVLAPGQYTVVWHAVSEDSHRTQGSFTFTIGR